MSPRHPSRRRYPSPCCNIWAGSTRKGEIQDHDSWALVRYFTLAPHDAGSAGDVMYNQRKMNWFHSNHSWQTLSSSAPTDFFQFPNKSVFGLADATPPLVSSLVRPTERAWFCQIHLRRGLNQTGDQIRRSLRVHYFYSVTGHKQRL